MLTGTTVTSMGTNDLEGLDGFLPMVVGFMFILIPLMLVLYVVQALALYKIAENQGYDKPWLAWIPIVNAFMIPILVEDDVHDSLKGKFTVTYILVVIGCAIVSLFIPFITIVSTIMYYYAIYILMDKYSERPGINLVVTILTGGLATPFQLFRYRNREPLK